MNITQDQEQNPNGSFEISAQSLLAWSTPALVRLNGAAETQKNPNHNEGAYFHNTNSHFVFYGAS